MTKPKPKELTYEEKEQRLEEILERLDRSETPMDELASDAREASQFDPQSPSDRDHSPGRRDGSADAWL